MNNEKKELFSFGIGMAIVVGVLLIAFGVFAVKSQIGKIYIPRSQVINTDGIGAAGDINRTARIAQVALITGSTTVFATSDSNGRDRIIESIDFSIQGHNAGTGWGLASSTLDKIYLQAATSSNTAFPSNTNYLWHNTVATTTPTNDLIFTASTSPGNIAGSSQNRIWKAGSNVVFRFRENLTGNATTVPSAAKGFINIHYGLDM